MHHFRILLVASVLAFTALGARAELQQFATSTLVIDTASGPQHFNIELATTPAEQEQGLMYRDALAPDAGMLFIFSETQPAVFWMKNTLIPLDMLFIAADGRIADIHERAIPMSEANIVSKMPVKAVLEVNGGTVDRLKIKIGDVVHDAVFGNAVK
ncbi:MAG TPA: DUF192 domain-containing protein [Stellaceae bacterium]|nr:DUF192 domain-containing protein [Stellaceae bacterium]